MILAALGVIREFYFLSGRFVIKRLIISNRCASVSDFIPQPSCKIATIFIVTLGQCVVGKLTHV